MHGVWYGLVLELVLDLGLNAWGSGSTVQAPVLRKPGKQDTLWPGDALILTAHQGTKATSMTMTGVLSWVFHWNYSSYWKDTEGTPIHANVHTHTLVHMHFRSCTEHTEDVRFSTHESNLCIQVGQTCPCLSVCLKLKLTTTNDTKPISSILSYRLTIKLRLQSSIYKQFELYTYIDCLVFCWYTR